MAKGKSEMGLVQVYTGNGKGKTTAALGLAVRATGKGYKVYMIQFMKGKINYGELKTAKKIPGFTIKQMGRPDFVDRKNPDPKDVELAQKSLKLARKIMGSGKYDMLILDELNCAVDWGLVPLSDALALIKSRPPGLEVVVTGRYARPEMIELADLVTEMKEIKHPYQKGVGARKGIEL